MRVLTDTHAFLWFLFGDARLPKTARNRFMEGTIVLSKVSLWEIAIKSSLGKLKLGGSYDAFLAEVVSRHEVEVLDLELTHLGAIATLPLKHRDPFDRMLIAQAAMESLPILTNDRWFARYGVQTIW